MSGYAPPPDGMEVEISHDGVVWTLGGRPGALLLAQGCSTLAAGLVGFGTGVGNAAWALGIPAIGLALLFFGESRRRSRVRVNDRAITVERRSLTGTEVTRIPLDELEAVTVSFESGAREWALVLSTPGGRVALGVGRSEAELHWMSRAIAAARDAYGRREQAEGRDWKVLRKVPEDLERLRS